ncbi:unnamed protein product, partial [Rotaria sp. Silwood2]
SYKKCIFIYYDGIANHYSPLYFYNKTNEEEEKSNFKYDNQIMRSLPIKFIQQKLEYNDNIDFEEIKTIEQPAPPLPNENNEYTPTETSRSASETTNGFFRQPIPNDGNCLFAAIFNILCTCEKITPASLRKQAADYNRQPGKIDEDCLLSETGNTVEQYCEKIEKTNAWSGEAEIRAIAESHEIMIRVVNVNPERLCVSISEP